MGHKEHEFSPRASFLYYRLSCFEEERRGKEVRYVLSKRVRFFVLGNEI